jgi:hypothetical protein
MIMTAANLTISANKDDIAAALERILHGGKFNYIDIIHGMPQSRRMLMVRQAFQAVKLLRPLSSEEMAVELLRFGRSEARYDSSECREGLVKGWSITRMNVNGHAIAVATATWVEKGTSLSIIPGLGA